MSSSAFSRRRWAYVRPWAAAMALWTLLSVIPATSRAFPNVFKVLGSIKTMIDRGVLWKDISSSLISVISGYALGFVIALPVAILMAWYKPVRYIIEPWIQFIRNIPPLAYVPLIVIAAGYSGLMEKFIHSNPGLESRFNRFLLFEDYSLDELVAIFKMRCGKGYILSPEAEPLVRDYIAEESAAGDSFGNARGVRNIFEHILVAQNNRLAKLETVTRDDLMTLTADDVLRARGKLDE